MGKESYHEAPILVVHLAEREGAVSRHAMTLQAQET